MRTIARPWQRVGDLSPLRHVLTTAHESFLTGTTPSGVRPEVLASWRRSMRSGVDPEHNLPPVEIDLDELDELRQQHPLAPVMPIVRRLLVGDATDAGLVVAVGDTAGRCSGWRATPDCAAEPRRCTSSRAPGGTRRTPAPTRRVRR